MGWVVVTSWWEVVDGGGCLVAWCVVVVWVGVLSATWLLWDFVLFECVEYGVEICEFSV